MKLNFTSIMHSVPLRSVGRRGCAQWNVRCGRSWAVVLQILPSCRSPGRGTRRGCLWVDFMLPVLVLSRQCTNS